MIRISVIRDNIEIPLVFEEQPTISTEEFEHLFDLDTAIKGGISIGVQIPIKGNELALDFAHAVAIRDNNYLFFIRIYNGAEFTNDATLAIEKANIEWNKGYFDTDIILSQYSTLVDGKTLRDVMTTEVVLGYEVAEIFTTITTDYVDNDWPQVPVNFPMVRLQKENSDVVVYGNQWNASTNTMIETSDGDLDFSKPVLPQVYLAQAVKECFTYFGYKVGGPVFDEKGFTQHLLQGLFTLQFAKRQFEREYKLTTDQTFSNTPSNSVWGELVFSNSSETSLPLPSPAIFTYLTGSGWFVVKLSLVVKSIDLGAKIKIKTNDVTTVEIPYNVFPGDKIEYSFILSTGSINFIYFLPIGVTSGQLVLDGSSSVNIIDVDPDDGYSWTEAGSKHLTNTFTTGDCVPIGVSVSDFLAAVKKTFQLKIDINEVTKQVVIKRAETVLKNQLDYKIGDVVDFYEKQFSDTKSFRLSWANDPIDLTKYSYLGSTPRKSDLISAQKGALVLVQSENAYYFVNESGAWEWLATRTSEVIVGTSPTIEDVKFDFSLIDMKEDAEGVLPTLFHKVDGNYVTPADGDWQLALMTYYNREENNDGVKPFASSSPFNAQGGTRASMYLFLDNGVYSHYTTNLKSWFTLLTHPEAFLIKVRKPYSVAMNLIKDKIIYWKQNRFIVRRTQGELGEDDTQTEIEMVKL